MQSRSYLLSTSIPDSYYAFIITTSYVIFRELVPAQAAKLRSSSHLNNRAMHICRFVHNL